MRGLFITIEGGDGSGKTTQIKLLMAYLKETGQQIYLTREPGGTQISEEIREIILNTKHMEMADITEALLYAAARAQHVHEVILPKLEGGYSVICDRFVDSSVVYQGYARGIGIDEVEEINGYATLGLTPDLTILLDLPAEEGLRRKKQQQVLDRLELQADSFHIKVSEGYRLLAKRHQERILSIDAMKSMDDIHQIIVGRIKDLTGD